MKTYTCTKCGKIHEDLPSIGFSEPFYYQILNEEDKENGALINEDLCRIEHEDQTDYFIYAVLQIPIQNHDETLDYGVWVSVSEKSFKDYFLQIENDEPEENTYFGMISNWIGDYETDTKGLHMDVETQLGKIRPLLTPHESMHPLVLDWKNGITYEEAQRRISKAFGNE
ncbi:DUF2199 domain-containing protein [Sphingobacterium bovistauri]|uniref:DUF2199 domain-containing protein n=1 Tax=Sphingobacterium bovistauri TaxID=2781959 RepID=A0ABS7Z519_9SPHI|nr:DUF2199 domain-containing protein [Sphingobacterium bovistauri]MCA5005239.1 DUF2199 domain-containing protein [Sphingobacterium bovistauri]